MGVNPPCWLSFYANARYLDPKTSRWLSSDPAMADGLNWYRYANNNPIMYSDPTGLSSEPAGGGGSSSSGQSAGSGSSSGNQETSSAQAPGSAPASTASPQDNANGGGSQNVSDSNTAGNHVIEQWQLDKMAATHLLETMSSWIGNYIEDPEFRLLSAKEFGKLPAEKQYAYLVQIAGAMGSMSPHERGAVAMYLRSLNKKMKVSKLMKMNEIFMNDTLRPIMNMNYDGTGNYTRHQIDHEYDDQGKKVWKIYHANSYHQNVQRGGKNSKWTSSDNREVIFFADGVTQNMDRRDIGTYNYGQGHWKNDVNPYWREMEERRDYIRGGWVRGRKGKGSRLYTKEEYGRL